MEANTLYRIGGEESWGKERSPRAQKVYRAWSENTDASQRDEAGLMPQTQTPDHTATRSQCKALVHLIGNLMLKINSINLNSGVGFSTQPSGGKGRRISMSFRLALFSETLFENKARLRMHLSW